jgi:hypothetical protein
MPTAISNKPITVTFEVTVDRDNLQEFLGNWDDLKSELEYYSAIVSITVEPDPTVSDFLSF